MTPVTDPTILNQLNAPTPVTDPAILAQLNSEDTDSAQGRIADGTPISADPSQRSLLDKINRQAQLAGRLGVEGMMFLPSIPPTVANLTRAGFDKLAGVEPSSGQIPTPLEQADKAMDYVGLPTPEGVRERLEADVLRSIAGARTSPGASPVMTTSAATAGLSGGGARELGANPKTQFIASLAGGLAGPSVYSAGQSAFGAVQPLFEQGRQQIVNNILARYADDPPAAAKALFNAQEYVPGSTPIAGGASKDLGLLGMEKTLTQDPRNFFGSRISDQNVARWNLLNNAAGTPEDVAEAEANRAATTAPLYEQAKAQYLNPEPIKPVVSAIDQEMQFRDPQTTGANLLRIKDNVERNLPQKTESFSQLVPQQRLIDAYRVERDRLNGLAGQGGYDSATVGNVARPFNQMLGKALESQSEPFAKAQAIYRDQSVPIDQMKAAQLINQKIGSSTTRDLMGNPTINPGQIGRILANGTVITDDDVKPLAEALSPSQYAALQNVGEDVSRSNLINSPMVRPPGSNTFNATASAGHLANTLASKAAEKIPVLGKLYHGANEKIIDQLAQTMLDPKAAAAALLAGKRPSDMTLAQKMIANALLGAQGGAIGYAGSQYPQ